MWRPVQGPGMAVGKHYPRDRGGSQAPRQIRSRPGWRQSYVVPELSAGKQCGCPQGCACACTRTRQPHACPRRARGGHSPPAAEAPGSRLLGEGAARVRGRQPRRARARARAVRSGGSCRRGARLAWGWGALPGGLALSLCAERGGQVPVRQEPRCLWRRQQLLVHLEPTGMASTSLTHRGTGARSRTPPAMHGPASTTGPVQRPVIRGGQGLPQLEALGFPRVGLEKAKRQVSTAQGSPNLRTPSCRMASNCLLRGPEHPCCERTHSCWPGKCPADKGPSPPHPHPQLRPTFPCREQGAGHRDVHELPRSPAR